MDTKATSIIAVQAVYGYFGSPAEGNYIVIYTIALLVGNKSRNLLPT